MDYFPIFIDLRGRPCLVVGGGGIAERKVALLREAGADVTVVAPTLTAGLDALKKDKLIQHLEDTFSAALVTGRTLVIAATDDAAVNVAVAEAAEAANVPVNVVDTPDRCRFVVPSIVDRSPVVVAVSTGGASPVLARLIRARLETLVPAAYGRLAAMTARFRDKVKARFDTTAARRGFWERILQGPIAEMVFSGREREAEAELEREISQGGRPEDSRGEVYLVGAGPGDPDLLTFRALRLMQQADVVVYDRLVSDEIMSLVRRDADRIYAGKERDNHAIPQEEINKLLARLAKEGKRVCRLKGGDPFIFGRGGEEIELLMQEGIPFQVVPGITAASGCSTYAGIPLTHRDYSQSVAFVTGHLRDGTVNLNWDGVVQPNQTLVIYMGLVGVVELCKGLIDHGLPEDKPIALVQQGTTRHQRVFVGTLKTMPDVVKREEIKAPTLIIVGDVIKLRDKLSWFRPEDATQTTRTV